MKTFVLFSLLILMNQSHGAFQLTVNESIKPAVKVRKAAPKSKRILPVSKVANKNIVKEKQPNTAVVKASDTVLSSSNANLKSTPQAKHPTPNVSAIKSSENKYEELVRRLDEAGVKKEKLRTDANSEDKNSFLKTTPSPSQPSAKPVSMATDNLIAQVNVPKKVAVPMISEKQVIKPLLMAKKGDTVEQVLDGWAKTNSYVVVYELGIWKRIKDLKLSTSTVFDDDFSVSVKSFLDRLNSLSQLKNNNVTLFGCDYYKNKHMMIKANEECDK